MKNIFVPFHEYFSRLVLKIAVVVDFHTVSPKTLKSRLFGTIVTVFNGYIIPGIT